MTWHFLAGTWVTLVPVRTASTKSFSVMSNTFYYILTSLNYVRPNTAAPYIHQRRAGQMETTPHTQTTEGAEGCVCGGLWRALCTQNVPRTPRNAGWPSLGEELGALGWGKNSCFSTYP